MLKLSSVRGGISRVDVGVSQPTFYFNRQTSIELTTFVCLTPRSPAMNKQMIKVLDIQGLKCQRNRTRRHETIRHLAYTMDSRVEDYGSVSLLSRQRRTQWPTRLDHGTRPQTGIRLKAHWTVAMVCYICGQRGIHRLPLKNIKVIYMGGNRP